MVARCLAMFALALGLVLMHHTVIAAPPAAGTPSVQHEHAGGATPSHAAASDEPPREHHGDHRGAMLLHLCLAVLAALGVMALLVLHARLRRPSDDGDDGAPLRVVPAPARPPPVPLRLARLQVLRL